ncbi:protoglobin domain-containing protein [Marinobacterium jannaschii]|uniref:protoglobin domain-containing protein n=1 Tax=Marinobacterium jannaschii TaxID=64970 RepID=UPI00055FD770|nr:protoglobin domain-containing protein [Marinobacterium jannaschii]
MQNIDFSELCLHGKAYSGLTAEDEALLLVEGPRLIPHLQAVTDQFYHDLQQIPAAAPFLEGRLDALKTTHKAWLEKVVTGPYDAEFAAHMHKVGDVHVKVKLPVEFMASGIGFINRHLIPILAELYAGDTAKLARMIRAVSAATGFCLIIMQESYQSSLLAEELDHFLAISGISRTLFNNLAAAYKGVRPVAKTA